MKWKEIWEWEPDQHYMIEENGLNSSAAAPPDNF